jgi:hypothetical protein
MRRFAIVGVLTVAMLLIVGIAGASMPGADVRLTNDNGGNGGYVSNYTLATGIPYSDDTLRECSISRGRENEPSVAVDPRNTQVLLGSSNDYCGVYNRGFEAGAVGPIWLGYYRSTNGGSSFTSSLVPGYPDDESPYAALSKARTASAGDPVIAWDKHGRAFFGSESSDDPAGTKKTFGDVWVARYRNPDGEAGATVRDGLEYWGTTVVAGGSSAPNLLGKFNDKTAIEADRTNSACEGNVYFAYSRFTGNGGVGIYFSRSTDHGVTFSNPMKVSASIHDVQFPDIAVTGNGHVYVTFRQFESGKDPNAAMIVKSTDCGKTFAPPVLVTPFIENDAQDESSPEPIPQPQSQPDDPGFEDEAGSEAGSATARDCGDFADACTSGFTFFRRDTQVRSTADQLDATREWVYIVYDATKPGTEAATGSTYHTTEPGMGGQAATYFIRYDGASGAKLGPSLVDSQSAGHQVFPDISADGGILHAIWWDSRWDPCYSVTRPIGNCANRTTNATLAVYAAKSTNRGASWTDQTELTDANMRSNPNYEQFDNRAVPFAGDYLWVSSVGDVSYGVWTDWRNTVKGTDQRETPEDEDAGTADVVQCRVTLTSPPDKKGNVTKSWSGDQCPHAGGLDQDIYGDKTP